MDELEAQSRSEEPDPERLESSAMDKVSTSWDVVQLARHPQRPHALDYIERVFTGFHEIHGDRTYGDDPSIVCGFGFLRGQPVMVIGQEKGRRTEQKLHRNFGMPKPEGYRKALRAMKLAEKFGRPIVTLLDTPGAYPGMDAEERGQAEAIARNIYEMGRLRVPIIVMVIGEGASGGALGIGVGDRVIMMENAWYSVISPEPCSTILWKDQEKAAARKADCAEALRLSATDLLQFGVIDEIVPEPFGGAHRDHETAISNVRKSILKALHDARGQSVYDRLEARLEKYSNMGAFDEVPDSDDSS